MEVGHGAAAAKEYAVFMDRVICPHCQSRRISSTRVPKDVVVVMPCPACSELVVFFRRKVIALDRKVLEAGTRQERKMHIATIIAEFLEPGLLKFAIPQPFVHDDESEEGDFIEGNEEPDLPPISEREVREFTRVHLRRLDNADYFRRHLE